MAPPLQQWWQQTQQGRIQVFLYNIVTFRNCNPSQGFTSLANDIYNDLKNDAPPHSRFEVSIEKKNGVYYGYSIVELEGATITAFSSDKDIYETLFKNVKQLSWQIKTKKQGRKAS